METVVILGAGQMGRAARNLLNMNNMELVAIGDNNPQKWDYGAEIQILPIAEALMAVPIARSSACWMTNGRDSSSGRRENAGIRDGFCAQRRVYHVRCARRNVQADCRPCGSDECSG